MPARARFARATLAAVITATAGLLVLARPAEAQRIEISPAVGYRFGLSSYTYATGPIADEVGAPTFGVTFDVKYARDRAIEGLFSRQAADVVVSDAYGRLSTVRVVTDYWHGGATQDFGEGQVRPFVAGTVGVTRYSQAGISEIRFSVGAGGGVKLLATPHVGVKLDGRLYATIVNGTSSIGFCGPGICFLHLHVGAVWQADFSAGMLIAF